MTRTKRQIGLLFPVMVALYTTALAGTGGLDPTFDENGHVELQPSATDWVLARSVIEQDDGKIVVAGILSPELSDATNLLVARVDTNGVIDATFGNGGFATGTASGDRGSSVLQQADGKLVVAGTSGDKAAMWRFNRDGIADAGFGVGGTVDLGIDVMYTTTPIVEQSDGRLVTAVSTLDWVDPRLHLLRLNADGSTDTSFGAGGRKELDTGVVLSLRQQSDGKLLLLHSWDSAVSVTRVHPDGSPDPAFGDAGTVRIARGDSWSGGLTVQDDGRIVAVAHLGEDFWFYSNGTGLVFRLLQDGTPDSSFGDGGVVVTAAERGDSFQAVAMAPDGDILVGGSYVSYPAPPEQTIAWDFALTRLRPDGSLNEEFGSTGRLIADFSTTGTRRYGFAEAMAVQSDGRVLLAGNAFGGAGGYAAAVARFEIEQSESAGRVRASSLELQTTETSGILELRFERINGWSGEAVVHYETIDGDAVAGLDYVAASGELVWGDGDTDDKTIQIEIIDDATNEQKEKFEVRIAAAGGNVDVAVSQTTIVIMDDDLPAQPTANAQPVRGGGSIGAALLLLLCLAACSRVSAQKSCIQRA